MNKKAVILDLDNTIYGVPSIGDALFAPLYKLIHQTGKHESRFAAIKHDILRKPFQVVAATHGFSETLTQQGLELLSSISYDGEIHYFPDYEDTRQLTLDKYLVTTGFLKLQQSKIRGMGIEQDFKEIHIVDPATSSQTKRDVFAGIMERNGYRTEEVLVVGDDIHSEIKAAQELNIDVVVYDKDYTLPADLSFPKISSFTDLLQFL